MKKLPWLLFLLLVLFASASFRADKREVEQLRLAQTLGLDAAPDGLVLTLAAPSTEDKPPLCLSAPGPSLSLALDQLRGKAGEDELFCGHLQQLLLGRGYAERGLESLLSAVSRSTDLRLDMPVYLLPEGSAQAVMEALQTEARGVCDLLNGFGRADTGSLSSAGRILRDLDRQGSCLVRAMRLTEGDGSPTLEKAGYGVLAKGRLVSQLDPELDAAVELLTGELKPCPLLLRDNQGRLVTLELQQGRTKLFPLWDESGTLEGLELRVQIQAAVLEIEDFTQAADPRTLNALTARLESELSGRLSRVLRLSADLQADFLGLGSRLELQSPLGCRGLGEDLGALLSSLRLRVTVQGSLRHSNDLD